MRLPPIGEKLLEFFAPFLESIAPYMPGEIFPYFFSLTLLQRALIAAILVTMVSGFLGCFLFCWIPFFACNTLAAISIKWDYPGRGGNYEILEFRSNFY